MNARIALAMAASLTALQSAAAVVVEYGPGRQLAMAQVEKADRELAKGDLASALRDANEALRMDANFFPAFYIRAVVYLRQRKWNLAIQDCNAGLKQDAHFVDLAIIRAIANRSLGQYAASLAELDHVIGLNSPRVSIVSWAFAWLRSTCADATFRNGQKAVSDAKRACTLSGWKSANELDTLAAAYAEAGDFASAVRYEQQAMSAPDSSGVGETLRNHLDQFQHGRPLRETVK